MRISKKRWAIASLAAAGFLDSLYMLAYEQGVIDSLICPFFGEGCNTVGRSRHARHLGVPNALVGVGGYGAMAALALWPRSRGRRRTASRALSGIAVSAAAAGAFLTWEQKSKVRAYCFWCLLSTGLSFAIAPLAIASARRR